MSFQISESATPVLAQQPKAVQDAALEFNRNYASKNSVKVRAQWGALLEQIQSGLVEATLGKGEKVRKLDGGETFAAVCRELGIPRSTAYSYINTHIAVSNYPQEIQEAAEAAHLNLALPHVMAEFQKMNIPPNLDALQIKGIIAQLQDARPARTDDEGIETPLTEEQFQKSVSKLVARAKKSGIHFRTTLETLIVASYDAKKTYDATFTADDAVAELQRTWASRELEKR